MKVGRYIGNAFTRYVLLPSACITFSLGASAQRYDSDIKHYAVPDMNGDGVPEVVTSVNSVPGGGSRLCLLKSGAGADYSDMAFSGDILKTKLLVDDDGFFIGLDVKTDEGNGTHYLIDAAGARKASRRQIRQAL